jgi:hypothetical protein
MTLPPVREEREVLHARRIECHGYRRADGLWDIEGHLVDTKSYAFENRERGTILPGQPLHDMWLRLTIDDSMVVRAATASTDSAPYRICGEVAPRFEQLVGLTIGKGWRRAILERLGGAKGCTHLVELLGPIATTAFQTMAAARRGRQADSSSADPARINSCHAYREDGPLIKERSRSS